MTTLCVDLGLRGCGCALFGGVDASLWSAAYVRNPSKVSTKDPGAAQICVDMARAVRSWQVQASGTMSIDKVIVEFPQVYTRNKSKCPPSKLMELAGVGGAVLALIEAQIRIRSLPSEWKKTVDGDVMVDRIRERLRETGELSRVADDGGFTHNTLDACGIGLRHFGRLERVRVFPR